MENVEKNEEKGRRKMMKNVKKGWMYKGKRNWQKAEMRTLPPPPTPWKIFLLGCYTPGPHHAPPMHIIHVIPYTYWIVIEIGLAQKNTISAVTNFGPQYFWPPIHLGPPFRRIAKKHQNINFLKKIESFVELSKALRIQTQTTVLF